MNRSVQDQLQAVMGDPQYAVLRRSFEIYYGNPERDAAMDALYGTFVRPGELAFDIGSHVGDRIGAFRRLGARVVAVEPQPECLAAIRVLYGDDADVTVVEAACGRERGQLTLHINSANPTVSTASGEFISAAAGAPGWEEQVWDRAITVEVTTLDHLIERFGEPKFAKIDVEGFEADVLAGLTKAISSLSFEFTTIQRDVALRCVDRLMELGSYRFNAAFGESQRLSLARWVDGPRIKEFVRTLPHEANSGDIYAVLD